MAVQSERNVDVPVPATTRLSGVRFDLLDLSETLARLDERAETAPFAYVVTINSDHFVRLNREGDWLRKVYEDAWLSVCDSRVLRILAKTRGHRITVVTGSDLTELLFTSAIKPDTKITVIGGKTETINLLASRFGLTNLAHHNPPMGFINDPQAVDAAVEFVESHPAKFVFFCVGSPQQERLAAQLAERGIATGVGLCIGAAIEFSAGVKPRAPLWMQNFGLEWLHRLASEPRRLWRRYLLGALPLLRAVAHIQRPDPDWRKD